MNVIVIIPHLSLLLPQSGVPINTVKNNKVCDKKQYKTNSQATDAIKRGMAGVRVYFCNECVAFHTTSTSSNQIPKQSHRDEKRNKTYFRKVRKARDTIQTIHHTLYGWNGSRKLNEIDYLFRKYK